MVAAAKQARRRLFVAQCIRFWPAYATARDIIRSRKHGKVRSAVFTRLSATPTWSWKQWLHDPRKSGSAALDLHIHDSDYILYVFGKPKSVFSRGCGSPQKGFEHIVTTYDYGRSSLIMAEGAWEYSSFVPVLHDVSRGDGKSHAGVGGRRQPEVARPGWFVRRGSRGRRRRLLATNCGISSIASHIAEPQPSFRPTPLCRAYG